MIIDSVIFTCETNHLLRIPLFNINVNKYYSQYYVHNKLASIQQIVSAKIYKYYFTDSVTVSIFFKDLIPLTEKLAIRKFQHKDSISTVLL